MDTISDILSGGAFTRQQAVALRLLLGTVVGGGSGGSGVTGSTTIDFGAFPGSNTATAAVTGQAGIGAGSRVNAWLVATATGDHTIADHTFAMTLCGVGAGSIVAATGFTIYAQSNEKMQGTYTVHWAWY